MTPTSFKDKDGKTWDCKINLSSALLVDRSDFSILTPEKIILSRFHQDSLQEIFTNPAVMFAVIGVLVRNQCKENFKFEIIKDDPDLIDETHNTEDEFQRRFTAGIEGPQMETAKVALVEAISDFFPAAKTVLSTFLTKLESYREIVSKRLDSEVGPMLDAKFQEEIDKAFQELSGSLQTKASGTS